MGFFGSAIGNVIGSGIGQMAGGGRGRDVGGTIGGALGSLTPFHTGGRVTKGKTRAVLKVGEYVLPVGIKPTVEQKKKVAALHRKKNANGKNKKK